MAIEGMRPTRRMAYGFAAAAILLFVLRPLLPPPFDERLIIFGLPGALLVLAALGLSGRSVAEDRTRLLSRLGDASYALYLLHPFALRGVAVTLGQIWPTIPPLVFLAIGLSAACALALVVWRYFERPLTRALQGRS
jgi:peptidoglycan/LPS O-acetylase OafA/YrhL